MVLALFMMILMICAFMLHLWGLTGLLSQDPETLTLTPEQARASALRLAGAGPAGARADGHHLCPPP